MDLFNHRRGLFPPIDREVTALLSAEGESSIPGTAEYMPLSPVLSQVDMVSLDESILQAMREEIRGEPLSSDRFYYSLMYDHLHDAEGDKDDFSHYNARVAREMALRSRIASWQREKETLVRDHNLLRVVEDLDGTYQPTQPDVGAWSAARVAGEARAVGAAQGASWEARARTRLGRIFLRKDNSRGSAADIHTHGRSSSTGKLSRVSSRETKVIDEGVVGQVLIDRQPSTRQWDSEYPTPEAHFRVGRNGHHLSEAESSGGGHGLPLQTAPKPPNVVQRKLRPRHLQMIAFGGTLGVGLLLAVGKSFSIAGPLGTILGFLVSGVIVLCTMLSYCEMITLIPLAGGLSGISSRFVDDAFGFSLSFNYWMSYTIGLPTEIVAATIMMSYYSGVQVPDKAGNTLAFIFSFIVVTVGINLFDVRVYGEMEYFSSLIKLVLIIGWIILMFCLNQGKVAGSPEKIGFRFWDSGQSNPDLGLTFGAFRPTFDVNDRGTGSLNGIGGGLGRFLGVLVSAVVAGYSYTGTDIVLIAAGEARAPRTALPKASKNIFWRIGLFYILGAFAVGLNFYSGDPRLLHYYDKTGNAHIDAGVDLVIGQVTTAVHSDNQPLSAAQLRVALQYLYSLTSCSPTYIKWAGFANGSQSPWVIALHGAGICTFASVFNGFMIFFALSSGSSQLYASSRTLYYMSTQGKAPAVFLRCSGSGVPYVAVLFSGLFSLLAVLAYTSNTAVVFQRFLSVCSTAGLLVWSGMCLSFIRFYYALQYRPDIISRDDPAYPYRSPFQPYLAYVGCFGSFFLILSSGFIVFLDGNWDVSFFFSCYLSLLLFVVGFLGYKAVRGTRIHLLDQLDLDSGRRELDKIIWEEDRFRTKLNFKQWVYRVFELAF